MRGRITSTLTLVGVVWFAYEVGYNHGYERGGIFGRLRGQNEVLRSVRKAG